jgi:monoamine oxidase
VDADVVIVGAGFAGLAAADRLIRSGLRPLIVEARDRIGGRTHTVTTKTGAWVDLGGQWIGPGQTHLYELCERFHKTVWPMYVEGKQIVELGERVRTYRGLIPKNLSPMALGNLLWAFYRLEKMSSMIPLEEPWRVRKAAELDQRTLGDWMRSQMPNRQARGLMKVAIEAVFAAHPDDIGLLHGLRYLRAGGGLERLTSSRGGAQQDRVEGGLQGLAESWSDWLQQNGVQLRLSQDVRLVSQDEVGATLTTEQATYRASRVIMTVPPALAASMEFYPAMPSERLAWCHAMIPGRVIKGFAIYQHPFWRQRGLSGQVASDRPPVHVAFDATSPSYPLGILLGFIEGRQAQEWSGKGTELRREAMLAAFCRWFGPEAADPIEYIDHDWTVEQWSRGCYAGVAGPGVTTTVARYAKQPFGRVHWAGTETADHWMGYVEGAVRSGFRAADEVIHV